MSQMKAVGKGQSPATEYSVPNQQLHLVSMTPPADLRKSKSLWPNGNWLQMECLRSAQGAETENG